jgi:hypothetical protein
MTIDLQNATAEDVVRALITLDGLRVAAEELRPGDRIIYRRRRGVIHQTIVADAHPLAGHGVHGWWSITTTNGDSWECSPRNTGQYRLPS